MLPDVVLSFIVLGILITTLILVPISAMAGWEFLGSMLPENIPDGSHAANAAYSAKSVYVFLMIGIWILIAIATCKYKNKNKNNFYRSSDIVFLFFLQRFNGFLHP